MTCDFDRIDALVAGELTDEERASVLTHMENCPICRAYYEELSGLEGDETAPEGFTARVMDAVRATPQRKMRRPLWRSMAAVAACAILVVGLGFSSGLLDRFVGADSAAPEAARSVDDAADVMQNISDNGKTAGDDYIHYADDLPLTIHTVTDEALNHSIRAWLEDQEIPELYAAGPREAYDLTLEQVQSLNAAIPEANLPEQVLQLELKDAE